MTNYERIKNMTIEQMVSFIDNSSPCWYCSYANRCNQQQYEYTTKCEKGHIEYLNQEVGE